MHRALPPKAFPAGFVPQVEIGMLEDGFSQRLKEKGLLLQLGNEALLEKNTEMECGQGVSTLVLPVWVGRSQDSAPQLCTTLRVL